MDPVDTFLYFTLIAYYSVAIFPRPTTKNIRFLIEKPLMSLAGTIILLNLIFNIPQLWFGMGVIWTINAVSTYFGYVQWNLTYKSDPSDAAQMMMFVWDTLIALCCFMKT